MNPAVSVRPMREADLPALELWLHEPHFARWILEDSTVAAELEAARSSIAGADPSEALTVDYDGRPIGWAQWYAWWDYPDEAAKYDALPGELGLDYGIGAPECVGRGLGTALIAALVTHVRRQRPRASILVGPSAANAASCRVLEKNGFVLADVRDIPGEPNASPIARYRLAPQ